MSFLCALKVDLYADTRKSAYIHFISRHFIQKLASGRLSPSVSEPSGPGQGRAPGSLLLVTVRDNGTWLCTVETGF